MKLKETRNLIDRLDSELLHLLAIRFELCLLTMNFKDNSLDQERETQVARRWQSIAKRIGIDLELAKNDFECSSARIEKTPRRRGINMEFRQLKTRRELPCTFDRICTLGPSGTNCELAAKEFNQYHKLNANIVLFPTLETAATEVLRDGRSLLMGCIAYPNLHRLMFDHINELRLVDVFVTSTMEMVMAQRASGDPSLVFCHPATQSLIRTPRNAIPTATSNSAAAEFKNAPANAGACITTIGACSISRLIVLHSFGKIEMGFTIHVAR